MKSGGKVWPPVYYDASMTLMSKRSTQQCLRFVTTFLQQTNENVTYKRGGSAVNPGNLCAFVRQHGGRKENFFSFQSDSDNDVTTLIRYITNIPTYYIYKQGVCQQP